MDRLSGSLVAAVTVAAGAVALKAAMSPARARRVALQRRAEASGVVVRLHTPYGPHARHTLDSFFFPCAHSHAGADPPALIVFVHGGLWCSGDKSEGWELCLRSVERARGRLAAIAVNYRLAPEAVHPAAALDVARALAWADRSGLRFDRGRVALVGHSVGAHTAALLATGAVEAALCPPRACVSLQGLFDPAGFCRSMPDWAHLVERAAGGGRDAVALMLAPREPHPGGVAWLLAHSEEDPWVDASQSRAFAAAAGDEAEVCEYADGGAHDESLARVGRGEGAGAAVVDAFLDRALLPS